MRRILPHPYIHDESGSSPLRAILVAVALVLLVGQAFSSVLLRNSEADLAQLPPPSTSPFHSLDVRLNLIGPAAPQPALDRLMGAVEFFQTKSYVPYVYGGNKIAPAGICNACSACVHAKHLAANSSPARMIQCPACRSCGLDCSHFMDQLFQAAGIDYKFADTATLHREDEQTLREDYGLIAVESDAASARPGDLALEKNHVLLVLSVDQAAQTVDVIHASRGSKRTQAGGVERVRDVPFTRFNRQVLKLLRHQEFIEPRDGQIPMLDVVAREHLSPHTAKRG